MLLKRRRLGGNSATAEVEEVLRHVAAVDVGLTLDQVSSREEGTRPGQPKAKERVKEGGNSPRSLFRSCRVL